MKLLIKQRFLLRRYMWQIRMRLPCPVAIKKKIISQVEENVRQYLLEHPTANVEQIEEHFGNPKTIAASYIADMDMVELVKAVYNRNKTLKIVCACASAALILCTAYFLHEVSRHKKGENDYMEHYIIDLSTEPVSDAMDE